MNRWIVALVFGVLGVNFATAQKRPPGRIGDQANGRKPVINRPIADGAQRAQPLLRKMLQAQGTLTYSGVRNVEIRFGGDRKRYVEIVLRAGPKTRIEFPDDSEFAGQIIVENRQERRHFFPDTNEIKVEPARFDEAFFHLGQLIRAGFKASVEPGDMIAGFKTAIATFADPQGNVLQRLWIDPNTGMILRRDLFDTVGNRTGYFEFTRVNFHPVVSPTDFEIKRRGAKVRTLDQDLVEASRKLQLPASRIAPSEPYALQAVKVMGVGDRQILAQVYTGPRGRVSLFQTRGPISPERLQKLLGQQVQVFSWRVDDRTFVLMGDTSRDELARLSRQVGP